MTYIRNSLATFLFSAPRGPCLSAFSACLLVAPCLEAHPGGSSQTFAGIDSVVLSKALRMIDVNGDGLRDCLRNDSNGSLVVGLNRGNRIFEDIHQKLPRIIIAAAMGADLNADGQLDLYLVSEGANVALLGDGEGLFHEATVELGLADAGSGRGAAMEDLDGDGTLDCSCTTWTATWSSGRAAMAPTNVAPPRTRAHESRTSSRIKARPHANNAPAQHGVRPMARPRTHSPAPAKHPVPLSRSVGARSYCPPPGARCRHTAQRSAELGAWAYRGAARNPEPPEHRLPRRRPWRNGQDPPHRGHQCADR